MFTELQKKLLELLKRVRAKAREEKDEKKLMDFGDLQLLKSEKPPRLTVRVLPCRPFYFRMFSYAHTHARLELLALLKHTGMVCVSRA